MYPVAGGGAKAPFQGMPAREQMNGATDTRATPATARSRSTPSLPSGATAASSGIER